MIKIIKLGAAETHTYFEDLVRLKYRSIRNSFETDLGNLERTCREKVTEIPSYIEQGKATVLGAVDDEGKLVGFLWSYPRTFLD